MFGGGVSKSPHTPSFVHSNDSVIQSIAMNQNTMFVGVIQMVLNTERSIMYVGVIFMSHMYGCARSTHCPRSCDSSATRYAWLTVLCNIKGSVRLKYIEYCNIWTINAMYIIGYIVWKRKGQIIHCWHQVSALRWFWEHFRIFNQTLFVNLFGYFPLFFSKGIF